jgi:arylamine N-acetyltransferase
VRKDSDLFPAYLNAYIDCNAEHRKSEEIFTIFINSWKHENDGTSLWLVNLGCIAAIPRVQWGQQRWKLSNLAERGVDMSTPPLSAELTCEVLRFLGVEARPPSVAHLDALLAAYTQTVPWESAFRIAKRARTASTVDCGRYAEEFWRDAIDQGGGGTCYESNYAFFRLLRALGYKGYLTLNNMKTQIGCHSAIVLNIDGEHWLADAGFPVYCALPLDPNAVTRRDSPYVQYTLRPDGDHVYQLERSPHPSGYCFTLIDQPIPDADYRRVLANDYQPNGLFLYEVIVHKIVDGLPRRFNSAEQPPCIEVFKSGKRTDCPITGDVAAAVAGEFGMDEDTVRAALQAIQH